MTEFGAGLLSDILETFNERYRSDKRLKKIANKVRDGTDFNIANDYSIRIGQLLSKSIQDNTKTLSYMSREVAEEILPPLLTVDYNLVTEVTNAIQQNMNVADGVMLGVQTPALDTNRISGFVEKVASYENYDEARWVLGEPIVNYSQSIVDQAIRDNARVTSKAGGKAYIVRETEPSATIKGKYGKYRVPCRWCRSLAGKYDYDSVKDTGNDVFRRHEGCRCTVTYYRGKIAKDAWEKVTWNADDADGRRKAIEERERIRSEQATRKAIAQHKRSAAVQQIMDATGYNAKSASIYYNRYKREIEEFGGVGFVIDIIRNTNPYARGARR